MKHRKKLNPDVNQPYKDDMGRKFTSDMVGTTGCKKKDMPTHPNEQTNFHMNSLRRQMGAGKGDGPRSLSKKFKDNYDEIDWGNKETNSMKNKKTTKKKQASQPEVENSSVIKENTEQGCKNEKCSNKQCCSKKNTNKKKNK